MLSDISIPPCPPQFPRGFIEVQFTDEDFDEIAMRAADPRNRSLTHHILADLRNRGFRIVLDADGAPRAADGVVIEQNARDGGGLIVRQWEEA